MAASLSDNWKVRFRFRIDRLDCFNQSIKITPSIISGRNYARIVSLQFCHWSVRYLQNYRCYKPSPIFPRLSLKSLSTCSLNEEKNGYVARDQLLSAWKVKGWTHAKGHWSGISVRSHEKDQSGILYHLHYRETWLPASIKHAQSTIFHTGWG